MLHSKNVYVNTYTPCYIGLLEVLGNEISMAPIIIYVGRLVHNSLFCCLVHLLDREHIDM